MKEEQKKVSGDSPHRIVNFNRKNLTSKEALEESSLHRAGRGINKISNRRSGAGKDVQGEAASLKTARSGKISITGRAAAGRTAAGRTAAGRTGTGRSEGAKNTAGKAPAGKATSKTGEGRTVEKRTMATEPRNTRDAERSSVLPTVQFTSRRGSNTEKREYSSEDFPLLAKPMEIQESKNKGKKPKHTFQGSVKVIPLGGLDQIGMNITAIETEDSMIIVDCGLAFPSFNMLGIDLVIPDITYIKSQIHKMKGFIITHGHEDHIGALPYVLQQINVPIYATKLTMALIQKKLVENGMDKLVKMNTMKFGQNVNFGDLKVEFVKTNHSIQDASALAITTPAGVLIHTGDFKVDYTPVFGDQIDLQRFAELGKNGVLAMMSDSTNAEKPGFTMSERTVGRTFDVIFAEHQNSRIIVATFASNVDRVQQIINSAVKYNRKVVVEGRSMVNVISVASELEYIHIPDGTLIDIENLKDYPDEQTVLITTGSQGESMAALSRMASGMHRKVHIGPNDVVVMSSHPIPGNELAVDHVVNELYKLHAKVIMQDTHVSGHACAEDLKLLYSLVKPKFAIPFHGEFHHRRAAALIAESVGVEKDNCLLIENGDVLEFTTDGEGSSYSIKEKVQAGGVYVDGLGIGDVGNIVLRDRQNLSQNGIIVVVLTLERYSGNLMAGPDLISRGFVYVRESEDLMEEARLAVQNIVDNCLQSRMNDWGKIKNLIKDGLSDFLWKKIKRNPVILPVIMEV